MSDEKKTKVDSEIIFTAKTIKRLTRLRKLLILPNYSARDIDQLVENLQPDDPDLAELFRDADHEGGPPVSNDTLYEAARRWLTIASPASESSREQPAEAIIYHVIEAAQLWRHWHKKLDGTCENCHQKCHQCLPFKTAQVNLAAATRDLNEVSGAWGSWAQWHPENSKKEPPWQRTTLDESETKSMHRPDSLLPFCLDDSYRGLCIVDADNILVVTGGRDPGFSSNLSWTARRGDLEYIVWACNEVTNLQLKIRNLTEDKDSVAGYRCPDWVATELKLKIKEQKREIQGFENAQRTRAEDNRDNQKHNDSMLRALDPTYVAGKDEITYEQAADLALNLRAGNRSLKQQQNESQRRSGKLLDRARAAEAKLREAKNKLDHPDRDADRDLQQFLAGLHNSFAPKELAAIKTSTEMISTLTGKMGAIIGVLIRRPSKDSSQPVAAEGKWRNDPDTVDLLSIIKHRAERGEEDPYDIVGEWALGIWDELPDHLKELVEEPPRLDEDCWTTMRQLPPGTLFETKDGIRAVKSNSYPVGDATYQCVLLDTGEFANFADGGQTRVREIIIDQENED